ncbi:peptidase family M13 [Ancylostoma ceylanicum]|uniref:Peptidase family M13 n=1 Tax=Ancylostoma ceylanicum TaxID=53326 RepID=A0A0D6LZK2_9BILA|nr:peptidase family M13 [Ancylostoma ceylanicum]
MENENQAIAWQSKVSEGDEASRPLWDGVLSSHEAYQTGLVHNRVAEFAPPLELRALNYGGIGAVIGHEITHGFDDQGSQFDSIGNLLEWWDTNTKKKFQERAQCIINQYGKTEVAGTALRINGKLTQGENIADNGGIKQAFRVRSASSRHGQTFYQAYKNYLKRHGEERRIKGLEQFNNEQMFFLGYAAVCPVKLLSPSITCDYRP